MADTPQPGFWARTGALFTQPRLLARRDLDRRDGTAGDDLIVLAVLAILFDGAPAIVRSVLAFAGGRTNGGLHQVSTALRGAIPIVAVWGIVSLLLWLFTFRVGRRAVGELGARVASGLVLASSFVGLIVSRLPPSPVRYTVESLPWAVGALLFGLILREAIEPLVEPPPVFLVSSVARWTGFAMALLLSLVGFLRFEAAVRGLGDAVEITARKGASAPDIDLPLLGGGRVSLSALKGQPVVLSFWATWCGPCLAELPTLQKIYAARTPGEKGPPLVYLVNVDEPGPNRDDAVRAVQSRLQLTMPIALDDGKAGHDYSISTIPSIARIDRDGTLGQLFDRSLDESDLRDLLR